MEVNIEKKKQFKFNIKIARNLGVLIDKERKVKVKVMMICS
jgi:hypothetical protein